ncbi:Metallo-dependent phosphatase-like protein [Kalaharituber pfeilii]|nr:Metallo-dependent phosphatase-like protein [Kalaharituber pfeilii]
MPRDSADSTAAPTHGKDTIRILIATDSHVGYMEDDPIRGDDSWQSFHEIMTLAKDRDVDMVLLSGDLFHENKPSRKAMYQVMRTLRMNCYGEKPCSLQILSDTSTVFQGTFNHANYEDPDINISIPVFSIHGNHDDPSGGGRFSALDLLSVSGLLNYFGRIPENDNIVIHPILLQKGGTKVALYGMSNVRDERLFRTFRDGKVKFLRPAERVKEWFNLMCLHQNHHAHTQTNYLPENFLQEFLDLIIWGHEHECIINPRRNPEMGFDVIQPGSSIATSLAEGEAVPKYVGILSITGREYGLEPIRLKTVRPFAIREIKLSEVKELKTVARKTSNRTEVTAYLMEIVNELIDQACADWLETQEDESLTDQDAPLPLIRLRVEYSAPEGSQFEIENPQRFSNRFVGKVANVNDVVQFYRKKSTRSYSKKGNIDETAIDSIIDAFGGSIDKIRVEKLVQGFLESQTLNVLPQNGLGDAIGKFIEKDEKRAVETFVNESLEKQVKKLLAKGVSTEEAIMEEMNKEKSQLEELFAKGLYKTKSRKQEKKAKPDDWDSDIDGPWEEEDVLPTAGGEEEPLFIGSDLSDSEPVKSAAKGKGKGKAATTTAKRAAAPKKVTKALSTRSRAKKVVESESEEEPDEDEYEDEDVMMDDTPEDGDEDVDHDEEVVAPTKTTARGRASAAAKKALSPTPQLPKPALKRASPPVKKPPSRVAAKIQTKLPFVESQSQETQGTGRRLPFASQSQATQKPPARASAKTPVVISDDDIEDDDVFEPAKTQQSTRSTRSLRKQ